MEVVLGAHCQRATALFRADRAPPVRLVCVLLALEGRGAPKMALAAILAKHLVAHGVAARENGAALGRMLAKVAVFVLVHAVGRPLA